MSAIACLDYHIETNCQEICEYFISIYFAEDNLMQYCFPVAAILHICIVLKQKFWNVGNFLACLFFLVQSMCAISRSDGHFRFNYSKYLGFLKSLVVLCNFVYNFYLQLQKHLLTCQSCRHHVNFRTEEWRQSLLRVFFARRVLEFFINMQKC